MKKFREELRGNLRVYSAALAIITVYMSINSRLPNLFPNELIHGFMSGSVFGVEMVMVVLVVRTIMALRNEEMLEELYIEAKDERNMYIKSKIGGNFATYMCIFQIVVAVLISYIDFKITIALYAVTMVEMIIRLICKVYLIKTY